MSNVKNKAWKFGDNIDTDAILPAQYLNRTDSLELAKCCFTVTNPEFCENAARGDVIVAGANFGSGSSREHAPIAIKYKGIRCVIARSFARIFYRNAFNVGLPLLESEQASQKIQQGDQLVINLEKGEITNAANGEIYPCDPIPENMVKILQAGGLMDYLSNKRSKQEDI
ncbi:3-isopropylmalate dehydratase small subunit [Thermodesulfobacteriota bacterium]